MGRAWGPKVRSGGWGRMGSGLEASKEKQGDLSKRGGEAF